MSQHHGRMAFLVAGLALAGLLGTGCSAISKVKQTYDSETRDRVALKEQIAQLTKLNQQVSAEANNLAGALRGNTKTQGAWGELILERIFELSGLEQANQRFREFEQDRGQLGSGVRLVQLDQGTEQHLETDRRPSGGGEVTFQKYLQLTGLVRRQRNAHERQSEHQSGRDRRDQEPGVGQARGAEMNPSPDEVQRAIEHMRPRHQDHARADRDQA